MNNWTKIGALGSSGSGNEQLNSPTAVTLDFPYLWIADISNTRVLKWKLQGGTYVDAITDIRAYALEVIDDKLYVMDTANEKVHMYNKNTLNLIRSSNAFSNLSGMIYWRDHLYIVDDSADTLYRLDPNTLSVLKTLQISGVTDAYEGVAALGNYLYVLTDAGIVYRVNSDMTYDNASVDLSAYMSAAYYINAHEDYLFISGNDTNFVVIDSALQVIEDVTYDTTDWSSMFDVCSIGAHVFIAADFTADQLAIMYGFDRSTGKSSGDTITINDDGDWDFGDDIIIGGSEANLTTLDFVRSLQSNPQTRNNWKEAAY